MQEISPQQIQQVVHALNQNGIQTEAIYEPIGCSFHPSPQDIVAMIKDRDAFFAAECGITKEDYIAWKQFIAEGCRCTSQTRKGVQCRNRIRNYQDLSPQNFVKRRKADDLHCSVHSTGQAD